jgi:UDP-galactopyranose mutase
MDQVVAQALTLYKRLTEKSEEALKAAAKPAITGSASIIDKLVPRDPAKGKP